MTDHPTVGDFLLYVGGVAQQIRIISDPDFRRRAEDDLKQLCKSVAESLRVSFDGLQTLDKETVLPNRARFAVERFQKTYPDVEGHRHKPVHSPKVERQTEMSALTLVEWAMLRVPQTESAHRASDGSVMSYRAEAGILYG